MRCGVPGLLLGAGSVVLAPARDYARVRGQLLQAVLRPPGLRNPLLQGVRRIAPPVQPLTAPRPPVPIARGLAGPGLLAHVIVSKFCDHLPLYRCERMLARFGVSLSRSSWQAWRPWRGGWGPPRPPACATSWTR
jgi:hypothetical protein